MNADEARELAWAVLRGTRRVPRTPPQRLALARALPRLAEELRCTSDAPLAQVTRGLEDLWDSLEPDEFSTPDFGTPQLGAGCLEAASALKVELAPKPASSRYSSGYKRTLDLTSHLSDVARPRVLVPLANAAPARVLYTARPVKPSLEADDALRDTATLVHRFLGVDSPHWWLDEPADGRSKMAALFLRVLLEEWPEAHARLFPGREGWHSSELPIMGITGELDEEGLARPVEAIADKVDRFFKRHPAGRLLVPASQWKEARQQFKRTCPPPSRKAVPPSMRSQRWWQVQPFQGVLDLVVRLRLTIPGCPDTGLFEKLLRVSKRVTHWNGKAQDISATAEPAFVRDAQSTSSPEQRKSLDEDDLCESIHRAWFLGRAHPAIIEGGPGSGKSIALRRLAIQLLSEKTLLGPALRVDARALAQHGLSLEQALSSANEAALSADECQRLVPMVRSPALAGSVWLVIDGLDEVQSVDRSRVRGFADRWPGPVVMGARPLANEAPGAPHYRIRALNSSQQQRIFELEERPRHYTVLKGESSSPRPPGDRRKETIAELCETPLGVSMVAMLPEEALRDTLNVPEILRSGIDVLLERAQGAHRITAETHHLAISRDGLAMLGAATWSMLRRGETTLTRRDLDAMRGPQELQAALWAVLDNSDLVQRAGPGRYQFSHKSLAEFCAAWHLLQHPGAEEELLAFIGQPGPEAVVFHFGALLSERERATSFLQSLTRNGHRPMSSLMLATRLLLANGPEHLDTEAAIDVFARRLRLASHLLDSSLPGRLDDTDELWLALGRWAPEIRPRAEELIAACSPQVGQFLRGELMPLPKRRPYPRKPGDLKPETQAFAERLTRTLGLELPLRILTRFRDGEALLLERPPGPWAHELESLVDEPEDPSYPGPVHAAASVWAQRATPRRQLERLDMLSRCPPAAVRPVLTMVLEKGSEDQKREALIRAALNSIEWGRKDDEGDWIVHVRFARRFTGQSGSALLRQWEFLWASGLLGDSFPLSQALEPLYAQFTADSCGPARWRALVAYGRLPRTSAGAAFLRSSLRDPFRAVRIEALAQIARNEEALSVADVGASLISQDDAERWAALAAIGAGETAPIDFLLAALSPSDAPPPMQEELSESKGDDRRRETPWEQAMREHGAHAQQQLQWSIARRFEGENGLRMFFELLEGPHGPLVEKLGSRWYIRHAALSRQILATGSPRQRRVVAESFLNDDALIPYAEDPQPEIAARAHEAIDWRKKQAQLEAEHKAQQAESLRQNKRRRARERRPEITSKILARHETFERLWQVLPRYNLPRLRRGRLLHHAKRKEFTSAEDRERSLEWREEQQRQPVIQRLLQLYRSQHQPLLLAGLEDEDLAPFSMALLRKNPPLAEVLPLIPRRGALLERVLTLLSGTPHGAVAARFVCQEMLAGRLLPEQDTEGSRIGGESGPDLFRWRWCDYLAELDGLAAFLPLLDPHAPENLRHQAVEHIELHWAEWEHSTLRREELLNWARGAQFAQDDQLREIALRALAIIGSTEDAEHWRPELSRRDLAPRVHAAAVRLVSRFPVATDLPLFRGLVEHSPLVSAEAVMAIARVGGEGVVEELLRLLESPPACLGHEKSPWGAPWRTASVRLDPWRQAAAEPIIHFGDASQVKRAARAMADDSDVWEIAARHLRLPEHLLFIVGHLKAHAPDDEMDNGHDEAMKRLERMIEQVGAEPARRIMLEASLWGEPFRECFISLVEEVREEDKALLLACLRESPGDALARKWLLRLESCEEALDALWRENAVAWWAS